MKFRKVIQLNTLISSALDHLEPSIGTVTGAVGSELSTIETEHRSGLTVAGEDTPINLKDVLGFDLHVTPRQWRCRTGSRVSTSGNQSFSLHRGSWVCRQYALR